MEVVTTQPLVAATLPWATDSGKYRLTVMVKATFQLRHGETAAVCEPYPFFSDVHHDDNPGCSLSVATDWVPRKRNAEVLFLGNAYAPYGEQVPRRTVRLSVATAHGPLVDKSLLVLGERLRNKRTGMTTRPEPFARVPLRYELTFGGAASPHNPVGVGVDAQDVRLPAIGYPMDARQVAGLGPLSPTWRPRARLLGGVDPKVLVAPIPQLPDGFEFAFFNAAPEDQQLGALSGHEEILLSGLHLTLPEVRSRLPGMRATAKLAIAGDQRDVPLVADTLWISGDTLRACITYRGDLEVTKEIAEGLVPLKLFAGLVAADPPSTNKPPTRPSIPGPRLEAPMASSIVRSAPVPKPQPAAASAPPTLAIAANAQLPPAPAIALKSTQRGPELADVASMVKPSPVPSAFKSTQRLLPSQAPIAPAAPVVVPPRIADAQPQASFTTTVDDASAAPFAFASADAPPMAPLATPGPSLFKMTVAAPSSRPWLSSVGETHQPEEVAAQRPIEAFRRSAPGLAGFVPAAQLEPPGAYPPPPPAFEEETDSQQRISLMPLSEERVFDESAYDGKFAPPVREGDPLPMINATRFVAFSFPWQLRPPQDARVIVVKVTCDLVPNAPATLAEEQMLPSGDVHYPPLREGEADDAGSLRYASDFVPFKPKADVMVVGTMRPGAEGNVGVVTVSLGSLQKKLAVFGTRLWGSFGASTPEKFDAIAMRWEHALGGPLSLDNPIGVGFKTGIAAPHLEDPDELLRGPGTVVPPACFAPVHASWRPRASKIGTYGKKWLETRWPYLPDDFDWAYFNAAAPPMQIAYPAGDERWTLGGFGGPPIGGRLPALRPRAFVLRTEESGADLVEVLLRLDTVWFDADAKKMVLVYRGLVETSDDVASDLSLLFVTRDRESAEPLTLEKARARLHGELAARELLPKNAPVAIEADNAVTKLSLSEVYAKMGAKLDEAAAERRAPPAPAPTTLPAGAAAPARAKAEFGKRIALPATMAVPPTMKATMADVAPPVFLDTPKVEVAAPPPPIDAPPAAPSSPDPKAILAELKSGGSLAGRDLTGIDLAGADLSGADLTKAVLTRAKLRGAKLDGAKLVSATLTDVDAEEASFATADLTTADLSRAKLDRANLSGATLQDTVFDEVHAHGARFANCAGERPSFIGASLVSAVFDDAQLASADFTRATIEGATFSRANLPDVRLLDANGMDVVFDEAQLPKARGSRAKLPRASFRGAKVDESVWEKVDLEGAIFERASLRGALFVRAVLDNATFSRAEAIDGCFRRASLRYAKLMKANLMRATFEAADLTGADLRGANLYQAETWKAKLTHARTELAIVAGSKLET